MGKFQWGNKVRLRKISTIIVTIILVIVVLMGCFLASYIIPIPVVNEYFIRYKVVIKTNDTDGYVAYLPIPDGNDILRSVLRNHLISDNGTSLSFVTTRFGEALRVVAMTSTKVEVNYTTTEKPEFKGITLVNESLYSLCYPQDIHYRMYFGSPLNSSAQVLFGFHIEFFGGVVGSYHEGGFSSLTIKSGWNVLNGSYEYWSSTAC